MNIMDAPHDIEAALRAQFDRVLGGDDSGWEDFLPIIESAVRRADYPHHEGVLAVVNKARTLKETTDA